MKGQELNSVWMWKEKLSAMCHSSGGLSTILTDYSAEDCDHGAFGGFVGFGVFF